MRPMIGESVDVIENGSVMSRWSSAVADRFVPPARRTFGVSCRVLCLLQVRAGWLSVIRKGGDEKVKTLRSSSDCFPECLEVFMR